MSETKEQLVEAAVVLLNEKGYENVSLRQIAKAAGTTIGNLTYHYPQKEALLLAILKDVHSTFLDGFKSGLSDKALLENTVYTFLTVKKNRLNHPFYYNNLYEITKASETVKNDNLEFQDKLFHKYYLRLTELKKENIIRNYIEDDVLRTMAGSFIIVTTVWGQTNLLAAGESCDKGDIFRYLCDMLKAVLEENYLQQYETICDTVEKQTL